MTLIVPVNHLHEQRGEAIMLAPRRRRLSTIMRQHGPADRRAVPLVFRKGQDWRTADRAALDRAARMRARYRTTLVGPDDTVVIVRPPFGRSGTAIGFAVAALALTLVAGPAGSAVATAIGGTLGAAAGFAVQGGLVVGAAMVAQAAARARSAKKTSANEYASLQGGGNVAKSGDRRPLVYGRCWTSPPLAQPDYFIYAADRQVVFKRMTLGLGEFQVHAIRIGNSILWDEATGVQAPFDVVTADGLGTAVENLYEQPSTIMGGDYISSPDVGGQELPGPSGNPNWTPWFRLTPHGVQAQTVIMSWQFAGFGYTSSSGSRKPWLSGLRWRAQRLDPLTGNPTGPVIDLPVWQETGLSSSPIRRSTTFTLPDLAEWRISAQNIQDPNPGRDLMQAITWDEMTAVIPDMRVRAKTTEIVLRIGGAKGLPISGLSDVQVDATRIVPVWDGTQWTEQATRKAVWAYADLVRNEYGLNKPDAVDVAKCLAYAQRSDLAGSDEFNGVLPTVSSFPEAANEVLAPLRAEYVKKGSVYSFMRDESAAEAGGRYVLSRRRVVRDSGHQRFMFTRSDSARGDVIVEFLRDGDPKRPDEVRQNVLPLTRTPKRYRPNGIVSGEHAQAYANYLALIDRYRGAERTVTLEWEGRLLYPGTHTLSDLWFLDGKAALSVVAANNNVLTLGEPAGIPAAIGVVANGESSRRATTATWPSRSTRRR